MKDIVVNYEVWQANKNTSDGAKILFLHYDWAEEKGLVPTKENYKKVYEGTIKPYTRLNATLEAIYTKHQFGVGGYKGHSLSVSDIIVLNDVAYYTDAFGFKQIIFE